MSYKEWTRYQSKKPGKVKDEASRIATASADSSKIFVAALNVTSIFMVKHNFQVEEPFKIHADESYQ